MDVAFDGIVKALEILRGNIQVEMEEQHHIDDNVQVLFLSSLENHRPLLTSRSSIILPLLLLVD